MAATARADTNKGPEILAICGTLTIVAVILVLLRLWVRIKIIKQLGWDDHFIAGSAVSPSMTAL